MRSRVPATTTAANSEPLLQRKSTLRIGEKGDRYEREADRTADAVTNGTGNSLRRSLSTLSVFPTVQREDGAKPKTEGEKYKEAAKKLGEAFLKTGPGKQIKQKAEQLGDAFISTLPGKVITGSAIAGAVATLAATHKELPIGIPEIPLDKIKPGLKLKITYEGPVDKPTKVMASFSFPLGVPKTETKPKMTKSEQYRAETARMAKEQYEFRESLKTPQQRAEEQRMMDAWLMSHLPVPGKLSPLGTGLPKPLAPFASEFKISGEQPKKEEPKKKEEDTAIQRKADTGLHEGGTPSLVNQVLQSSGQPLDPSTRTFMESRFGYDFSKVRIHTGIEANRSAEAVNALAYTAGEHIVFGSSKYSPHTPQGRHLLAHELAHVVQQSRPLATGPKIRRKEKPEHSAPTVKFYQYVIDSVANMEQTMTKDRSRGQRFVFEPSTYQGLKALLKLCETVEQENSSEIPKQLDAYMKADTFFHLGTLTRDLMIELATRMFKLGLETETEKLRKFYAEKASFSPGYDPGAARRNIDFYTSLVTAALSAANSRTPDQAVSSLDFMIRAFVPLRDALAALDQQSVAFERRYPPQLVLRPWMTLVEVNDALIEQIEKLFGGIEGMFQALIDTSAVELEQGKGTATLALTKNILETKLHPVLFPSDNSKNIAGLRIQITHTKIKKGRGKISDEFSKGAAKAKRSVAVTTYDPEQEYVEELHMPLERLYEARNNQVQMLALLYGAVSLLSTTKKNQAELTEDAKANAKAIKQLPGGRLRLHNDDDWRAFVLQKYHDMVQPTGAQPKKSPAEALSAVIKLLFAYLDVFTIHARYTNIYDIGDNYLNKNFPRALSGQLVHDCGVYALRVAYILSLVRKELALRFRFVQLPAHIALVIDGDQLPTYIVHNNHYDEISPEELANLRKDWEQYKDIKDVPDPSDPTGMLTTPQAVAPPGPRDEKQFIGELVGGSFILGPLDMPFTVTNVPQTGLRAQAARARLWAFYQRTASRELFGPASRNKRKGSAYLFHTRYLALTEQMRAMHNEVLLKVWNEDVPATWSSFEKLLIGKGKRTKISSSELLGLLTGHADNFDTALTPLKSRVWNIEQQERSISEQIRNDPALRRRGVRLGYGLRAATLWHYEWRKDLNLYRVRLEDFITELEAMATEKEFSLQDVRARLAPPFIPIEEKKIAPQD